MWTKIIPLFGHCFGGFSGLENRVVIYVVEYSGTKIVMCGLIYCTPVKSTEKKQRSLKMNLTGFVYLDFFCAASSPSY